MGITEIFLALSIALNWWQWGELSESEVKRQLFQDAAQACQEAKSQTRKNEIEATDEREERERVLTGIVAESGKQLRRITETDSGECNTVLYPSGNKRMAEHAKRTADINKRLRSTSAPDE